MVRMHNRYLPDWLHRTCNGVLGAVVLALFATLGMDSFPPGHWAQDCAAWLLYLCVPTGILLATLTGRFSLVEGIAGDAGHDELAVSDEDRT